MERKRHYSQGEKRSSRQKKRQSNSTSTQRTSSLDRTGKCWPLSMLHSDNCQNSPTDIDKMNLKLIQNHLLVEQRQENGDTPLASAVKKGHDLCALFLIKSGANVQAKSSGHSVLSHAVIAYTKNNFSELYKNIITLLLENGSDPNFVKVFEGTGISAPLLTFLIGANLAELVELFLEHGADPNIPVSTIGEDNCSNLNNSILIKNSRNIKLQVMKLLLDYGAKINLCIGSDTYTDIYTAIMLGEVECLKILLMYHAPLMPTLYGFRDHTCYATFIQTTENSLCTKLRMLRMLHKFGLNFWHISADLLHNAVEDIAFCTEFQTLRSSPLSLKCIARISILGIMGTQFPMCCKQLEIPASLHQFLKFPDA